MVNVLADSLCHILELGVQGMNFCFVRGSLGGLLLALSFQVVPLCISMIPSSLNLFFLLVYHAQNLVFHDL